MKNAGICLVLLGISAGCSTGSAETLGVVAERLSGDGGSLPDAGSDGGTGGDAGVLPPTVWATAGDFDPQTQQFTLSVVAADPQGLWLSGSWTSTCPGSFVETDSMVAVFAATSCSTACTFTDTLTNMAGATAVASVTTGCSASLDGGSGPDAGGGAADAGAPDSGDAGGGGGGPVYPVLVAMGDSITSGHHGGGSTKAVCDDAAYGYPSTVFYNLQNTDVANWSQGTYVNYAHSGFGTAKVIGGGTTPCGDSFTSPLISAENALTAHLNPVAPNRVVMTVGANNTNWPDVLTGIGKMYYCSSIKTNTVQGITTAAQCESAFADGYSGPASQSTGCSSIKFSAWNGPSVSYEDGDSGIVQGIIAILNGLFDADPNVQITIVNYYNVAGTGMIAGYTPGGPYMPSVCSDAVSARVADFLSWIDYAVTVAGNGKTTVVSPTPLNGNNSMLQQLTTSWWRPATNGWPHPNGTGHQAIADLIVPAPISCTCSADCNPTGQVSVGGLCTGGDPLAPNANLSGALSSACANEGEDFILNAGSISCSPGVDGGIEF